MGFKILDSKRKGDNYEFVVRGNTDNWNLSDLTLNMRNAVNSESNFYLEENYIRNHRYSW